MVKGYEHATQAGQTRTVAGVTKELEEDVDDDMDRLTQRVRALLVVVPRNTRDE